LIVNLTKKLKDSISRGKRFGEFHCWLWGGRFLPHAHRIARGGSGSSVCCKSYQSTKPLKRRR
jgi:hypothetical protein